MKKLLAGTLTAAFALGLTACGQQEECSAKPVIYLYPEQETTVSVSLDYAGTLTATYPAYEDGWRVTAEPDGTLYVMGQYRIDPAMGKYIVMYYGSFKRAYRHLDEDELTEEMRKVLRHEFRHHVEGRAGVRDLEVWDAEQIAMYKEQQADNE